LTAGRDAAAPAVAAVGLVGVAATVDSSTHSWAAAWITSVLAGLAVGGLVAWASHRAVVIALAAGAVVGATVSFPLRHPLTIVVDGPNPEHAVDTRSVGTALAVISLICLVMATWRVRSVPSVEAAPIARVVAVGLGITAVAWALGIWFESAQPIKDWYWGWVLVPTVLLGAVMLRRRCGPTVLVVALAWAVIHSADLSWLPDVAWLLVLAPLAAVGVVVGRRVTRPELLLVVLVPCAATWLITGGAMSRAFSVLALFVVPVVVVAAFTSEVRRGPVSPGVLATAFTAVALWKTSPRAVVFLVASFGKSESYSVDVGRYFLPQSITLAAQYVLPAVATLGICAAALVVVRRRASDA
ncbi:MAG: hypothetical protein INR72_20025, partial [Williamsia herbipolensis]|nr:hypothetical protein [Williamsia herbipolensis]